MRLEHLLSGAQPNDDVVDTEMTRDTPEGLLLLAKRFYLIILPQEKDEAGRPCNGAATQKAFCQSYSSVG